MSTASDILHDLERRLYQSVVALYPERVAMASVAAFIKCLYLNLDCHRFYVPKPVNQDVIQRNLAIWAAFNGRNYNDLASQFGLSFMQIHNIIKTMRREFVRKHQSDLFPLPDVGGRPVTVVVFEDCVPVELQRVGLRKSDAKRIAGELVTHLCATYPGMMVQISEAMVRKHKNGGNDDLFAESA